ncbi:MAG: phosphoribosyl-ATP pyrophosphohydrolase [Candidatus Paceibacterota bacterium]
MADITQLTQNVKQVLEKYRAEYPEVDVNRDYYPLKVTEEWGECMQAFLMYSDKGRQKGNSKDEIKHELSKEMADVLGFLLLFAENEGIDLEQALKEKWFTRLEEK